MPRSPHFAFPYFHVRKQASFPGLWDKPIWGAGAWIWGGKWCKRGPWLRSHFSEKCQCFREAAFPPPPCPPPALILCILTSGNPRWGKELSCLPLLQGTLGVAPWTLYPQDCG